MNKEELLELIYSYLWEEIKTTPNKTEEFILRQKYALLLCIKNNTLFKLQEEQILLEVIKSPYTKSGFGNMFFEAILLLHCHNLGKTNKLVFEAINSRIVLKDYANTIAILENGILTGDEETVKAYITLIHLLNLAFKSTHIAFVLSKVTPSEPELVEKLKAFKDVDWDMSSIAAPYGALLYLLYLDQQKFTSLPIDNTSAATAILNKNYKLTLEILTYVINKKRIEKLLHKVYNALFTKNNISRILEAFIKELEITLSDRIVEVLKDVYIYETKKSVWFTRFNSKSLYEIELSLDAYKQERFQNYNLSITDKFIASPFVIASTTQYKWHYDAGQDYQPYSHIDNLTQKPEEPLLLHTVTSTLSMNGYFEYEVNKYQHLIFTIFSTSKTLREAFNEFFEELNGPGEIDESDPIATMVATEFLMLLRSLIDRNTIIPEKYATNNQPE